MTPLDYLGQLKDKYHLSDDQLRDLQAAAVQEDGRQREALKTWEPLDWQADFHKCPASERVLLAENQAGKSATAYIELGRAVCGTDPYDKYPKRDGVAVIVGYDEKFIGLNPHRYLLKKGAFKIIRGADGTWEAWKPWIEDHKARESEAVPAPPILPKRMIKRIAWLKKKDGIFSKIELTTGWTILAFGSKGDPPPGFQADLVLIDEDIDKPEWYAEMKARLTIRKGKLIWAALPMNNNNEMLNLIDRAEEMKDLPKPMTTMYRPNGPNPYIDQETREQNAIAWQASGQEVYEARFLGQTSLDRMRMYPTFDPRYVHNAVRVTDPCTEIQRILRSLNGVPPREWTRYMVTDPGHSVCATLFLATPPPSLGDFVVAYQELHLEKCTAPMYAQAVEPFATLWNIEQFIIDAHGGRLTDFGTGLTPREQYTTELKKRNIASNRTGSGYIDGSDNIEGRVEKLRQWLSIRPDGTSKLIVVEAKCKWLCKGMKGFKKKRDPVTKDPTEDGNRRSAVHEVECLEYAAAHGCPYVKPRETGVQTPRDTIVDQIRRRQHLERVNKSRYGVVLGATG